jgi:dolichol-phosphate mannosyltransferase
MVDADAGEAERLLVFTATYNERHNIGVLLKGIWDAAPQAHVLVVDDNSPDGTGTLLDEIARSESRLTVIHRPAKLGLGTAHHLAMLFALRRGFDTLITMDADLSHDPQDIPRLTASLANADFVIGSRYAKGGSSGYSGYRHFVSAAANRAARLLLRLPVHEFTTSFRAFRVSRLSAVNFAKMHNAGYSFFMESVYRLHQAGFRLAEIPITFHDRVAGESKIPRNEIFRGMSKLLHLSLSRLVRRSQGDPSLNLNETCSSCGSDLVSELASGPRQFPKGGRDKASRGQPLGARRIDAIKCLVCGTDRVLNS